jgi:hypothetical protein
MDAQKPLLEQIKSAVPTTDDVSKSVSASAQSVSDSIANAKAGIQNSLNEFSSKSILNAGSEFLDSNGLLARFAFIFFVLIVFMMVMKVCLAILGYFMSPYSNPYVVRGLLDGSESAIIIQSTSDLNSVPILRSNDRYKGMEYTWSIWLKLKPSSSTDGNYRNIFVKGDAKFAPNGFNLLNGPGLYVQDVSNNSIHEYKLIVIQDHNGSSTDRHDEIDISSIPQNKWCHVAIRLQNMVMDIYMNGTIVKRHTMTAAPTQNYNNVTVHGNSGFAGSSSNLRYYSYALNVFEINNIIMFGPDTKKSTLSDDSAGTGNFSYLSNLWYSNQY